MEIPKKLQEMTKPKKKITKQENPKNRTKKFTI